MSVIAIALKTPLSPVPSLSNVVNCYGCECYEHALSRMNTSDSAYGYEWGAVEFIPNP